jgi:Ala-tRNA(Pro) deacylase
LDIDLEEWLNQNQIEYIIHKHPAVYTVEEAQIHCGHIPGLHCKNLFLTDPKKKKFYLLTLPAQKKMKINEIRQNIGAKKLSFAKPDQLKIYLGLDPGAVSPFGLVNDKENITTYFVDKQVWDADHVCFHPNVNTATLELVKEAFQKAIKATNNIFFIKDF